MEHKQLIVSANEKFIESTSAQLAHGNLNTASSASEALLMLKNTEFGVVIADEHLSDMDVYSFVETVRDKLPATALILFMKDESCERAFKILNNLKPFRCLFYSSEVDLPNLVQEAHEAVNDYNKINDFKQNESRFYESTIEAFNWKDILRKVKVEGLMAKMILKQLNAGLFQGDGIGSLVSTLGFLFKSAEDNGGPHIKIPRDIFTMAQSCHSDSQNMINSLISAESILDNEQCEKTLISFENMYSLVSDTRDELVDMLKLKNQRICLGPIPQELRKTASSVNKTRMKELFTEIFINAMKYSDEGSKIYVIFWYYKDTAEIKIINPTKRCTEISQTLTGENETLVFEPFYRLTTVIDERYTKEQYRFGLGLPVVKRIAEQHEGSVHIYTVKNHINAVKSHSVDSHDVCVSFRMPVYTGMKLDPKLNLTISDKAEPQYACHAV